MKTSLWPIRPLALTGAAILGLFFALPGQTQARVVTVPDAAAGASAATGQSLDEGTFTNNFQSTTATRGFWFTAPENFTITGLMVPTTVGTDVQNIEVFTLSGAPAIYGASTPSSQFNLLAYYQGDTSTGYISTNLAITAGQVVCILGARGTGTMNNSYIATNNYASSLDGMPVTLTRLIYQGNLNAGMATSVSAETSGDLSQVSMLYAVPEPSTWALLGAGTLGLRFALRRRSARA